MQPVAVKEVELQQIGVYQLGEEIGRGNVAVVYRATDTLYDREVALKVLHPYFAHYLSFVRHFIAEGREGMRLRHPNIVQVLDAGQSDGVAYIAQELITGGTLADMIQARGGPFGHDETMAVIEQAAAGLDYAHHLGCLHRNLKPSNIFFADHGRVQIADFSATIAPGAALPANYPVGTPIFMAPEQARGDATIDQRADIYSLGAVVFLMLSGRAPFEAENPLVLLRKIIEESPPLLERLQPAIDPALAQTVSQVLAKRPSARFVTANAFAQALARGSATTAHQEPPPEAEPAYPLSLAPTPFSERESARPTTRQRPTPTLTFSRQTVMLAGMVAMTLLLLLAMVIASVAPGFFNRIAGLETPAPAQVAILPPQERGTTLTPADTRITPIGTSVAAIVAGSTPTATGGLMAFVTATLPATATSSPPPTVRVVALAPATLAPTATPSMSPTATAIETATATDTPTPPADEPATAAVTDIVTDTGASTGALGGLAAMAVSAADSPPLGGRIAYAVRNLRTDQLDTVIYTVATGVHWPVLAAKRQPDFNNQGDLVLNSEGGGVDALVLMRPSTGELLAVASAFAEDSRPHWAPNNRSIVFDSDLVGDGRHRLYLQHDTDYGAVLDPLRYDAWEIFGRYPIFLLDGRIVYNGCNVWDNASVCGLYLLDLMGGEPQNLTGWPGDIPTDNLGNQVLLMSDRGGDWNVYLLNVTNGAVRQLTDTRGRDGLATASPDGAHIAFASDRSGAWAVYVMRSDGSGQRKLFDLTGGYGQGDRDWLQERLSWGR
jgi:eukaryotic-like serine/threonine-protein kinase